MTERMDAQEAFDALTRAHFELQIAFNSVTAMLCSLVVHAGLADGEAMADFIEAQAAEAGNERASLSAGDNEPNAHMLGLAKALRSTLGGSPMPFTVIQGGKQD